MSKLGPISNFLSPVSYVSLVLQGLRCELVAGLLNLVLSLSLYHTGHWKFNVAPHGKEKIIVALHKDGVGYKKIAKTLKLSCSMVGKTIQRFTRTGSTKNRPCHGRPKKLSARAQQLPKMDLARIWAKNTSADIIVISETWLNKMVLDKAIGIDGYTVYRADRPREGG